MKNPAIAALLMLIFAGCSKNDDDTGLPLYKAEFICLKEHFYYYENSKINLDTLMIRNKILVGFNSTTDDNTIVNFINGNTLFNDIQSGSIRSFNTTKIVVAKLTGNKSCAQLGQIINDLETDSIVKFSSYCYESSAWGGGQTLNVMSYTDEFTVRVPDTNDLSLLNQTANQTFSVITGQSQFNADIFYLRTTKNSPGDALHMSNYFYETGYFIWAEPNFYHLADPQ